MPSTGAIHHARPDPVPIDPEAHRAAFEFVRSLATELSRGSVELPVCPDVALRAAGLRTALGD